MIATLPLIVNDHTHGYLLNLFYSAWFVVWALVLLGALGYLIVAPKPDGEIVGAILFFGFLGGLLWPAVIVGGLLFGFVMGSRKLVHGRARKRAVAAAEARRRATRLAAEIRHRELDLEMEPTHSDHLPSPNRPRGIQPALEDQSLVRRRLQHLADPPTVEEWRAALGIPQEWEDPSKQVKKG